MDCIAWLGVSIQTDRVVPADEYKDGTKRRPGDFDQDVGYHECFPGICLGWSFSNFVQAALGDEKGHDLLYKLAKNGHKHKNAEHLVLKSLDRIVGLEERETNKERLRRVSARSQFPRA